ncbi:MULTISPECIES: ABC transporter ATP-binding protein [unclassified Pannonibacter]|uniref:ATP-binding cassette domain-containing protein n=1 Tax=unclassified Pannonibacter TaxID=2627228 RepID=UPI0016462193|nr:MULTISPECIES: ABC transporter ATP-binding protein [unclassified Pannonibacter]
MSLRVALEFINSSITNAARKKIFTAFGATAAHIAALLVQPLLVAKLVRDASSGGLSSQDMTETLVVLSGAMLISALFARLQAHCSNLVLQDIRQCTKANLYENLLSRAPSFFRDRNEGWLETSIATASQAARSIVYDGLTALARVALFITLCSIILILINPGFGAIFLIFSIIYIIISYKLAHSASHLVGGAVTATSRLASNVTDVFSNIEQVQLSNTQKNELDNLRADLDDEHTAYRAAQGRIDRSEFLQRLYLIVLFGFFVLSTAFIAGMDPSNAVLFYIIGIMAYGQLDSTGKVLNSILEMAYKLNSVLDAIGPVSPSKYDSKSDEEDKEISLHPLIKICNVSFSYTGESHIIRNLSLNIAPGSHIMITGRSGSGKSTLLKLISGINMPNEGDICIGGVSTSTMTMAERARVLSFVSQHATMFDRSLLDNVLYGCTEISRERAEDILVRLGLAHLKARGGMDWLDQRVDKNGLGLSGGERQRVLIARAILRGRPIMILDEATSALDNESEKRVFRTLHDLCASSTIIAVSHHPHAVMQGYRTIQISSGVEQEQME